MVGSAEILTAIRELSNSKSLGRGELHELLKDGIMAALAKKHGPNVQAEVVIDDDRGTLGITLLKNVVDTVEDGSKEVSLEDARFEDPEFQVGDVMEIPVDFAEFGRTAVQAESNGSFSACAKASGQRSATSSRGASVSCSPARFSRSSAESSW